jgi:hypothetical protein
MNFIVFFVLRGGIAIMLNPLFIGPSINFSIQGGSTKKDKCGYD